MKQFFFLMTLLVGGTSLFSQSEKKYISKITLLPGPLNRVFSVGQEMVLTDRLTLNTTVKTMPPTKFKFPNTIKYGDGTYDPFSNAKLFGIGNTTELRIYGKEKQSFKGFYWGPYLNFMYYKLEAGPFAATFHDENKVAYNADVVQFVKVSTGGGGLQIGVQGLIKDVVAIDWTILGIGFNMLSVTGGIEATNTSGNFNFNNYSEDIKAATLNAEKFLPLTKTVEPTKVELGLKAPIPHFKTSINIGIAYGKRRKLPTTN
jgi:hypothetical protein